MSITQADIEEARLEVAKSAIVMPGTHREYLEWQRAEVNYKAALDQLREARAYWHALIKPALRIKEYRRIATKANIIPPARDA
jgi:hypothetical protein